MEREENILLSLKKLDYLTRSQLQTLHDLKSERNAQRVLKQMDEYIQSFRDGENIYYLNSKGRERVGADKVRKKTGNVTHFIMRNYLYLAYNKPINWKNEMRITSKGITKKESITVVADAMFQVNGRWNLIEVDNIQKMKQNEIKVKKYRELFNRKTFGNIQPKLIWITITEYRRKQLKRICEGIETDIWTLSDFKGE
jgi:hypothetical protein